MKIIIKDKKENRLISSSEMQANRLYEIIDHEVYGGAIVIKVHGGSLIGFKQKDHSILTWTAHIPLFTVKEFRGSIILSDT